MANQDDNCNQDEEPEDDSGSERGEPPEDKDVLSDILTRDIPRHYGLTANMRQRVVRDRINEPSKGYHYDRAVARVQALPSRIEELMIDVLLLHEGNLHEDSFLTTEKLQEDIDEEAQFEDLPASEFSDVNWLLEFVPRFPLTLDMREEDRRPFNQERERSGVQIGFGIGLMMSRLEPLFDDDFTPANYLWGQYLALTHDQDLDPVERREKRLRILDSLEEDIEVRYEKETDKVFSETQIEGEADAMLKIEDQLVSHGIPRSRRLEKQVLGLIDWNTLQLSESQAEEAVEDLLHNTQIEQVGGLVSDLREDAGLVFSRKVSGEELRQLVSKLWDEYVPYIHDSNRAEDALENLEEATISVRNKQKVACRRIAVDETTGGKTGGGLPEHPILKETGDGEFVFTYYGVLVAYGMFERVDKFDWLYCFGSDATFDTEFESRLFDAVNDELELGLGDYPAP